MSHQITLTGKNGEGISPPIEFGTEGLLLAVEFGEYVYTPTRGSMIRGEETPPENGAEIARRGGLSSALVAALQAAPPQPEGLPFWKFGEVGHGPVRFTETEVSEAFAIYLEWQASLNGEADMAFIRECVGMAISGKSSPERVEVAWGLFMGVLRAATSRGCGITITEL